MRTTERKQQSAQYRDYAEEVNTGVDDGNTIGDITRMQEPPPALFPEMLFQMLQHIDLYEPDLANIVSWQPHGRSFLVHDRKRFEQLVLPRFFKQTKLYSSFRRQLKLWGFSRLAQQQKKRAPTKADCAVYYHELFLRSKAHLNRRIRRKCCIIAKSFHFSGAGGGAACEEEQQEPDFYTMTILPPSASSSL